MMITPDTKVNDILKEYPWLIDEAVKMDERAGIVLKNPMAKMLIKKATVRGLSEKIGITPEKAVAKLTEVISHHNA